ncbi:MAG: cyclopropane-fatty-acyl-phospholipid synthase family protein [Verrucomicrobiota bacterium]
MFNPLLERNLVPDVLVRAGIRRLLADRLRETRALYSRDAYLADLEQRPLAEHTADANAQHYEVPAEFFGHCLGRRRKYSGCLYPTGHETLDEAEELMLELYVERARLVDGQDILELGCGWGSLTLYLAERFPRSRITGVSNSRSQREYIEAEARRRALPNVRIVTCDMTLFQAQPAAYDRVVSVEMFEHMKNYRLLLGNIARWLRPEGLLFVHIFTHRELAYHFVARDESDWMARHFFTGGQMPAHDLLLQYPRILTPVADWQVDGTHYQRTAEHWLRNMDAHREQILPILADTYGAGHETKWWAYWRIFYMACAELWGYRRYNKAVLRTVSQTTPKPCDYPLSLSPRSRPRKGLGGAAPHSSFFFSASGVCFGGAITGGVLNSSRRPSGSRTKRLFPPWIHLFSRSIGTPHFSNHFFHVS